MAGEIRQEVLSRIRETAAKKEDMYSRYATRNSQFLRRREDSRLEDPVIRPPFFRDADRIIHSRAYTRYIDKTQVFFVVDNDHVTHRVLHVQLVSKIARTIGRALGLNEDLIEAISLGHDIGHPPFGHFGEQVLSELCEQNGTGKFFHNVESIQFLDVIENCNLTLQVLDGILTHNGESRSRSLAPDGTLDWHSFDGKLGDLKTGRDRHPLTLEGCAVRLADTIAFLGRDLEDALEIRLINDLSGLPEDCAAFFGMTNFIYKNLENINRRVLDKLIRDIIDNSYGKNEVTFSGEASQFVQDLYEFNMRDIYENPKLLGEHEKIRRMYEVLFNHFLCDLEKENRSSLIYPDMVNLDWASRQYRRKPKSRAKNAETVRDYIAGMTDRYFENVFKEMTLIDRVKRHY